MERKGIEFTVGLFVMAGLALLAGLIIYFGNFKEQFQSTYMLKVQFPNASGLIQGSQVKLMGAPVGSVVTPPKVIDKPGTGLLVEMEVRLRDTVRIRRGSTWTIGTSGLLGDSFIEVQPPPETAPGTKPLAFLEDGDTVEGKQPVGIADLASSVEPVLKKVDAVMVQVDEIATRLNNDYITKANARRLEQTLDEVQQAVAKLDGILGGVDPETVRQILNRANSVMGSVDKLFARSAGGSGVLYELLANPKTGTNLAAFIENLRKHGILFYSDSSGIDEKAEDKETQGKKKRSGPVLRELRD